MSASIDPSLTSGSTFGTYRIERLLGEGGMGRVYEATHLGLERRVALKTLRGEVAESDDVKARFVREARAAAGLRHPHVVDVYDVGSLDGVSYLAMELLDGEALAARLEREGALHPTVIADMLLPVCSAVSAAHAVGIIHRDLKPDNIFLARTRPGIVHPKLLDFGIARRDDGGVGRGLTQTGALLGTPSYMSPEQVEASKALDGRSDQYSLGVILYECATGALPFDAEALYQLLRAICSEPVTPPRAHRPDLPAAFEAVILRAMARDPSARFASVNELGRALFPFASETCRALWVGEFGGASPLTLDDANPGSAAARAVHDPGFPASTLSPVQTHARSGGGGRAPLFAALGAMLVTALGIVVWRSQRPTEPRPAARPEPAALAAPVTPVAPVRAVVTPPSPALPAALPTSPAVVAPPAPTRAAAPATSRRGAHRRGRSNPSAEAPSAPSTPPARGTNGIPF